MQTLDRESIARHIPGGIRCDMLTMTQKSDGTKRAMNGNGLFIFKQTYN